MILLYIEVVIVGNATAELSTGSMEISSMRFEAEEMFVELLFIRLIAAADTYRFLEGMSPDLSFFGWNSDIYVIDVAFSELRSSD